MIGDAAWSRPSCTPHEKTGFHEQAALAMLEIKYRMITKIMWELSSNPSCAG